MMGGGFESVSLLSESEVLMIQPSIGRVVWFYADGSSESEQPLPAIVTGVWGNRCVNLAVFERNGVPMSHPPTSVQLLQDDDPPPKKTDGTYSRHCRWLPYQLAKAKEQASA